MTRLVVLGAGIAGHTAAASRALARPRRRADRRLAEARLQLGPSNIWVGVGLMKPAKVTFPLAPVYERAGIDFVQAAAREIHPEGDAATPRAVRARSH